MLHFKRPEVLKGLQGKAIADSLLQEVDAWVNDTCFIVFMMCLFLVLENSQTVGELLVCNVC